MEQAKLTHKHDLWIPWKVNSKLDLMFSVETFCHSTKLFKDECFQIMFLPLLSTPKLNLAMHLQMLLGNTHKKFNFMTLAFLDYTSEYVAFYSTTSYKKRHDNYKNLSKIYFAPRKLVM